MNRNKKGKGKDDTDSPQRRKVSEMVHEFAEDFIRLGETLEQRQYRLNAACAAWNIACEPPEARDKSLYKFLKEYARQNPTMTDEEIESVCGDMEKLIEVQLSLFPDVRVSKQK